MFTEERKECYECENLFRELSNEDREYYYRYLRMSQKRFQHLFSLLGLLITKQDTNCRKSIPAKKTLFLRFVI